MIIFTVRVNYKSGLQEEFECTEFSVEKSGGGLSLEWLAHGDKRPLMISPDDVESVWQLDVRDTEMEDAMSDAGF